MALAIGDVIARYRALERENEKLRNELEELRAPEIIGSGLPVCRVCRAPRKVRDPVFAQPEPDRAEA